MKTIKIFYAWGLTILSGSFIIPIIGSLLTGEIAPVILLFIIIFLFISALSSLPAFAAMLIVCEVNREKPYKVRFKRVIWTHVLSFLGTLLIGNIWIYSNIAPYPEYNDFWMIKYAEMIFFSEIVTGYGIVAMVIWILMFRKEWRENKLKM